MMTAPQAVLVAIDFSEASARAVAVAGFIAQACKGRLTILHAESTGAPVYFTAGQLDDLERHRRAGRAAVKASVARFGREHTPTSFSVVVDDRAPGDAIVRAAAPADLVVMGTNGRRGPARWWLGSVAERAIHDVTKPVLVVRTEVPGPIETLLTRIVVHADSTASGGPALQYAQALAACCGGTVFDERGAPIEQALDRSRATIAIVARPHPRSAPWTSGHLERFVRGCAVPMLFVPEFAEGEAS
jgi:nucleotide-binding universal stress UspA family protein